MEESLIILTMILVVVSAICIVILTIFGAKTLFSLSKLSDNAREITTSIQKEIEPTLKELQQAAKSINSIANNADTKFQNAKTSIASVVGLSACLGSKLKSFTQGILKGISFGIDLFKK